MKGTLKGSSGSTGVALFAFLALVAVTYVQRRMVPATVENVIRLIVGRLGLVAVPLLIALAYRSWVKVARPELPIWRNGLGLGAMFIISTSWFFCVALEILGSIRPGSTRFFDLEWMAILLYS